MEITFEHLKLFRRCLFEQHTGTLEFHTSLGTVWLHMSDGYFLSEIGGEAIKQSVQSVLRKTVHGCFKRNLMCKSAKGSYAATGVLLDACYADGLSSIQIENFADHFRRFPPVSIKLGPMHKYDTRFPGFDEYIRMYEQSVLEGGIFLRRELENIESPDDLSAMIRLLIVLYLLGLMEPSRAPIQENIGVFGKLMKRIRNL